MSATTWILIAVCVVVVLSFILDKAQNSKKKSTDTSESNEPALADEAAPTSTGKFRVQQMLQNTRKVAGTTASMDREKLAAGGKVEDEEESLPDPFEK